MRAYYLLRPYYLRKARAARERAYERLMVAKARGDTRAIHAAQKALQDVTSAALQLELK